MWVHLGVNSIYFVACWQRKLFSVLCYCILEDLPGTLTGQGCILWVTFLGA
jgi:hypothetical protein